MNQRDKALSRLLAKPKDYKWNELVRVMEGFGYEEDASGGGSPRKFYHPETDAVLIGLHKPHGGTAVLKAYQIDAVIRHLKEHNYV